MPDGNKALHIAAEKKTEGVYILKISGRLDSDTYMQFDVRVKQLLTPSTRSIVLDMSGVDYVSSAALSIIFHVKKFLESNNGSLVIANVQPQVKKVLSPGSASP